MNSSFRDNKQLSSYYKFHSKIYDYTRWLFLFGRKKIISLLPNHYANPNILEIGCGTGNNLKLLADKYPEANITGFDLSKDMLTVARKKIDRYGLNNRVRLVDKAYGSTGKSSGNYHIILCSYSLSMMGSHQAGVINQIGRDLNKNGLFAVVDFHYSPRSWFRSWMQINHVEMDGSLYRQLTTLYQPEYTSKKSVYGNMWSYFMFTGSAG